MSMLQQVTQATQANLGRSCPAQDNGGCFTVPQGKREDNRLPATRLLVVKGEAALTRYGQRLTCGLPWETRW